MKANSLSFASFNLASIVLLALIGVLVFAVLSDKKLPLISGERAPLIALLVLGMALCTNSGINRVAAANAWTHPLAILGYLLGATILLAIAAGIFTFRLPFVDNPRAAFLVAAILTAAKLVLGFVHRLL